MNRKICWNTSQQIWLLSLRRNSSYSVGPCSSRNEKKYILSMFPYPSGRLHMGHLRVYTLSDALSRYYALKGYRVVHPIGWDAFGLPAENAAREKGIDAAEWTYKNIEEMRSQLTKTGVNFDWDREIFTCKPEYFRWTQWIFLQLYKHGLVRKTLSEVNWDPVDGTVLADEQVDENGCSWRSGAPVEKRRLRQWAVDTPRYAKRMLDGLGPLEFDWRGVADIQAAWIGSCDVYRFLLKTEVPAPNNGQPCVDGDEQFDLRLADPAQLGGAQFVIINKEHSLAREAEKRAKLADGEPFTILDNLCVINFVTGHRLPVVISHAKAAPKDNFILNARLGNASSTDPLDKAVSARLCLNAPSHIGISAEEVLMLAKDNNLGGYLTSRTLRDWIVSRQRAWGTPIPMILAEHDDGPAGNASLTAVEPMAEHRLPLLSAQRGQRTEAASLPSGWGRVETDTLDTYFDSSWYYLRYLDPNNEKMAFNPEIVNRSMPVDVYVGGVEHAKMHLFYARFISYFLHDLGMVARPEPFTHFIPLGSVRSPTYKLPDGKYVPDAEVDGNKKAPGARLVHKSTGKVVKKEFEKMSKSKHNGVDPQSIIDIYGVDQARMQLLIEARPNQPVNWPYPYPTFQLKSINRWIVRVQALVDNYVTERKRALAADGIQLIERRGVDVQEADTKFRNCYNKYVQKVSIYLEVLRFHNMALTRLQHFTKLLSLPATTAAANTGGAAHVAGRSVEYERCLHAMLVMAQVFAPTLALKQWAKFQTVPQLSAQLQQQTEGRAISDQKWPELDVKEHIDFLLLLYSSSVCIASVPVSAVVGLQDAELEQYAREQCHARFFQLLQEKDIAIRAGRIERIPGLCIVLNLEMADGVHKRSLSEIAQQISKERRARGGDGTEMAEDEGEEAMA